MTMRKCFKEVNGGPCQLPEGHSGEHSMTSAADRRNGPEDRREYDAAQFERDLDEAIEQARSMVAIETSEPVLSFKPGSGIEMAIHQVVVLLIWRKLRGGVALSFEQNVVWGDVRAMLVSKNQSYGDSALSPLRIFATASPMEQLLVRLDDKVSRLERGQAAGEDVANDLLGYLILVLIARIREKRQ